jgi:hypothetical protein
MDHFFNQSWRSGMDGDPDFLACTWRTDMNPKLPVGYLARERERLNSIEAAMELDGELPEAGTQFFPPGLIQPRVGDLVLPSPSALRGRARPVLGMDYGVVYDHSAAVLLYRLPVASLNPDREFRPVFLVIPHVWAQGTDLSDVVDDVVGWPIPYGYVSSETVGLGAMPSTELRKRLLRRPGRARHGWLPVATTAPLKLAAYTLVRWLLERDQLILPRNPLLLRQLSGVSMTQAQHGARFEAEDSSVHDDVVDALAFTTLPTPVHGARRAKCITAAFADPAKAVRDTELSPLDTPVIEAGCGLRLYREPALQSVSGRELTLLAPVRERHDAAAEALRERIRTVMFNAKKEAVI